MRQRDGALDAQKNSTRLKPKPHVKTDVRGAAAGVIAGLVVRHGPSRQNRDEDSGGFDCSARNDRWNCIVCQPSA
jgi:hypothetical protein